MALRATYFLSVIYGDPVADTVIDDETVGYLKVLNCEVSFTLKLEQYSGSSNARFSFPILDVTTFCLLR